MNDGANSRPPDPCGAFVAFAPEAPAGVGPLSGLRVAVKDNIAVAGLPFAAGHPLFAGRIAAADADAVRRLREAGARIVGVTHTDAGGFGVTTPVVANPVAPGRTVGGSSGGSAAAVASGLADVALGTDTGGSVRIPAACTGLIGFKPTRGRVPNDGVWPLSHWLDHVGVIGRELDVVARAADALLGPDLRPGIAPLHRLRLGVDRTALIHCDASIEAAFRNVLAELAAHHEIVPLALPDHELVIDAHRSILLAEAREVYRSLKPSEIARLAPVAQRSLSLIDDITPEVEAEARRAAAETASAVEALFGRVDLILSPTICCPVPAQNARKADIRGRPVSVVYAMIANTAPFNVSGHPALALPTRGSVAGLPFSLQVVARSGADRMLFDAARLLAPVVRLSAELRN